MSVIDKVHLYYFVSVGIYAKNIFFILILFILMFS